jgi:Na+/melibiose symporter-like transporter
MRDRAAEAPRTWTFWLGLGLGGALMAYGTAGLLGSSGVSEPGNFVAWFVGAGIVHDAVLAPVVALGGWLTTRLVPDVARNPVRLALALSALLVAITWPLVRRWGAREANPSLLPLDYGRNLVVALAVVWALTATVVAARLVRDRRAER